MSFDLKDYKIKEQIGQGGFGKVFLVEDKKGEKFVLKENNLKELSPYLKENIIFEASLCSFLDHKNITKCFGSLLKENSLYLLFEYANGGDLGNYEGKLSEIETKKMAKDILSALEYCHKHRICHYDMHVGNILVFKQKNETIYKLSDWGLAKEDNKNVPEQFKPCDKTDLKRFANIIYSVLEKVDEKSMEFIAKFRNKDPNKRISAKEALQDEWLREVEK